jgi:Fic family protein
MSAFSSEVTSVSNTELLSALLQQRATGVRGQIYWKTQIDLAYNSNRIEGVRFTKHQTRCLFEEDNVVDKAKTDDIIETRNHFRMFDYMLDHHNDELSIEKLQAYHRILKYGTGEASAVFGEWKSVQNAIGDGDSFTVPPGQVDYELNRLLETYLGYKNSGKPVGVSQICAFHTAFEQIHPFLDGNGRIGRVVMFEQCLTNDIAPFIVLDTEKERYYQALVAWPKDFAPFVSLVSDLQHRYKEDVLYLMDKNLLLENDALDELHAPIDKLFSESVETDNLAARCTAAGFAAAADNPPGDAHHSSPPR